MTLPANFDKVLLSSKLYRWLFRLRGPESSPIFLNQRRIFILPTWEGLVFASTLFAMLIASINYGLSLGYLLTFLLAGVGLITMIHTFHNLARLSISAAKAEPVFAGDTAHFSLYLESPFSAPKYAIGLTPNEGAEKVEVFCDVMPLKKNYISVPIKTKQRGRLRLNRVTIFTRYPLGWYRAWSYVIPDMQCIVYPVPEKESSPFPVINSGLGQSAVTNMGNDDFIGLRAYQFSDSPRQIAWKAFAQGRGLLSKQFSGRTDENLIFDWSYLPAHMDIESRLSRLTRWLIDAHDAGLSYGLTLPNITLPVSRGQAHYHTCLKALALFGLE